MKKSSFLSIPVWANVVVLGLISAVLIGPYVSADVGVIEKKNGDFTEKHFVLGSVFGLKNSRSKYEEIVLPQNAQTIALLQAPKNVDPQASSFGSIAIVDESVLSNENSGIDGGAITNTEFKLTSDQISLYTVRSGDSLEEIANMFDVTVNTIRWANDMGSKESIKTNQVLVILPIAGVKYVSKKGDTIASIAKQYSADANETASFNNIETTKNLAVGTIVIIPDADGSIGPGHESDKKQKNNKPLAKNIITNPKGSTNSSFSRPVVGGIRTQGIHGHNGVDIASALNTPILAAANGEVVLSRFGGWNGGYGNYIVIKHSNGMQTLYAHLNENSVSQGETVTKGQIIGKMGNTGKSTGVHLHFEVRGGKNPF